MIRTQPIDALNQAVLRLKRGSHFPKEGTLDIRNGDGKDAGENKQELSD